MVYLLFLRYQFFLGSLAFVHFLLWMVSWPLTTICASFQFLVDVVGYVFQQRERRKRLLIGQSRARDWRFVFLLRRNMFQALSQPAITILFHVCLIFGLARSNRHLAPRNSLFGAGQRHVQTFFVVALMFPHPSMVWRWHASQAADLGDLMHRMMI